MGAAQGREPRRPRHLRQHDLDPAREHDGREGALDGRRLHWAGCPHAVHSRLLLLSVRERLIRGKHPGRGALAPTGASEPGKKQLTIVMAAKTEKIWTTKEPDRLWISWANMLNKAKALNLPNFKAPTGSGSSTLIRSISNTIS